MQMTNPENVSKAKQLREQCWKVREDFRFDGAEKLLNEVEAIFEQELDFYNVTECLNHLAYNYKLQATKLAEKGFETAKESYEIAKRQNTKLGSVLRSKCHFLPHSIILNRHLKPLWNF